MQKAHRACAECKTKKLRCVPSREEPGVCHRCHEHGKPCAIPEAVRPRKRQSRLHARMVHLEEMMGSLVDRFSQEQQQRTAADIPGTFTTPSSDNNNRNVAMDPLMNGLVSFPEAESLCRVYRHMSQKHFPCVIIPENMSLSNLLQERPMLSQAIFVVASWQNRPRQMSLERLFLGELGQRFFVGGERSLDLLQGLLVYLSWYHFNVTESGQYHAYRLASLCGTMIVDLGLNRKPPRGTPQHDIILNSQPPTSQVAHQTSELWSHEGRRALVGAYIQSTLCSLMCRKQPLLTFTPYMEQSAASLQHDSEVESDKSLLYFVELLRIVNEVYSVFEYGDPDHSLTMSDDKVHMVVQALEGQLSSWRASLPPGLSQHAQLNTWSDMVGAYALEIGLHGNLRNPPTSARRVTIMFDCLAYLESYMKRALGLSMEDMQTWTAFDWRQLTYTTMLASKISVIIDAVTMDKESTARIARLDSYLGLVFTRTQELFSMTRTPQGQTHYFQSLLNQWKGIRSWYQMALQRRANTNDSEQPRLVGADGSFQDQNYSTLQMPTGSLQSLQSIDSWPDDNFGILPLSTHDYMMLESLGYS